MANALLWGRRTSNSWNYNINLDTAERECLRCWREQLLIHGMRAVFCGGAIAKWRDCAALLLELTLNLIEK